MTMKATALKKLLVAGAALGVLACTASPAAADFFELSYSTNIGFGNIFFTILPTGTPTGTISHVYGTETITNNGIANFGTPQAVTGPAAAGFVASQGAHLTGTAGPSNDNQLITNPTTPGANLGNWFSTGGISFVAADGTLIDLYDVGGKLREYALDSQGGQVTSNPNLPPYNATLTDLGAPGPVPGNGLPALGMLAALALTVKARGRFAR